jgi:hypothetical protein
MELPSCYFCSACNERFEFAIREAVYYIGSHSGELSGQVPSGELLEAPARPVWCKDCATVSIVEDIAPLRAFERAYGAVRAGRHVEYPVSTEGMSAQESSDAVGAYLRWRMGRRHLPRALCCGGTNFQHLDVETPLLKHQECDFGFIEGRFFISGYNGPGPGVYGAANIRVYNGEGELVGRLTWRERPSNVWTVDPARYPQRSDDA